MLKVKTSYLIIQYLYITFTITTSRMLYISISNPLKFLKNFRLFTYVEQWQIYKFLVAFPSVSKSTRDVEPRDLIIFKNVFYLNFSFDFMVKIDFFDGLIFSPNRTKMY